MKPGVAWNCHVGGHFFLYNTRPIFMSNGTKPDTLTNLKQHFKMLQNISLIVCIKKANKCVMIFPSQNDLNGALSMLRCMSNIFFIKLFITTLI